MVRASTKIMHVDRSLDVRGVEVPADYLKVKEVLEGLTVNQILELHLDEGEPLRRIPFGLRAEGHEIVVSEPAKEGVRLLVRKRAPL